MAIVLQIVWAISIGYPPTDQQVNLSLQNEFSLWLVRIASFFLIFLSIKIFSSFLDSKSRQYFWPIVFISPAINVLWLSYPIDCLKILTVSVLIYSVLRKRLNIFLGIIFSIIFLIFINSYYLHQDFPIFSSLSLKNSQVEVQHRMSTEDSITKKIDFPLIFRRLGYNKYYIALQDTAKDTLRFWDFESLFFQEVHPLGQKSIVLFYWPEAILLLIFLWKYLSTISPRFKKDLLTIMLFSWLYYIFSDDTVYKQLIILFLAVSLFLAYGLKESLSSKHKWLTYALVLFSLYGLSINYFDLFKNPQKWLDNRPYVYQQLLASVPQGKLSLYSTIYLMDLIGPSKNYCRYYIGDCSNFIYKNFDLTLEPPTSNSLYLGFIGQFIGPKTDNNLHFSDYLFWSGSNKFQTIAHYSVHDSVAYRFGDEIIVADNK
jgi:hypothetical protein